MFRVESKVTTRNKKNEKQAEQHFNNACSKIEDLKGCLTFQVELSSETLS